MNNNKQNRNTFQSSKSAVKVDGFSLTSNLFPELVSSDSIKNEITTISYKSILLIPESEDFKPFVRIKEETEYEIELKKQIIYQNNANQQINIMNDRWIKFRMNYIEMYGEDAYEKWYIPLQDWEEKDETESESEIESTDDDEEDYY